MLESNTKLYYSIKEVSELTKLKPYVLRYWESEFSQLKPKKNRAGNRTYKQNDIDLIIHIKTLLYDKKYTIKGAIEELKGERLKIAKEQYIKAFSYAANMDLHLWAMPLNFIKMTHNKLGFGKKLIWEK